MATFLQFQGRMPEPIVRFYYMTGEVLPLKIEAVRIVREMVKPRISDYQRFDASRDSYADIISALLVQPSPGFNRLIVVWRAEKLKKWDRILELLHERNEWNLYAIFVTDEDNPRDEEGPGVFQEFAEYGRLVECRPFSYQSMQEYVHSQLDISDEVVEDLLERCAFDTAHLINAIRILHLFDDITPELIQTVIKPQGEFEFAEAIWDDLSWALRCDISEKDIPKALGSLTLVLTRLAQAYEVGQRTTAKELADATAMPPFVAIEIMKLRNKVDRRRLPKLADLVAQADLLRRGGASKGLIEWLSVGFHVSKAA